MYINEAIENQEASTFFKTIKPYQTFSICALVTILCLAFFEYHTSIAEEKETLSIISNPKIDDIYFLDFRLLSDKLRPTEKYRLAKVVDITGDIITLVYGDFYYQRQNAAINSIKYSQLSYKDYFQSKRYDLHLDVIKSMRNTQAIYLAKRPVRGKLFNRLVGPEKHEQPSSYLTYGKKENISGEAFLNEKFSETNLESAFELFQASSNLGYAKGQVNLAEMYINGQYVKKDFEQALYWLKQASLQSYKPAILKYGIICKQVELCNIVDFYQELTAAGVNIKVRKLDFELSK
ncbi:sel1 repeat family protein [Colwellia sp. MSW7]|uniref:Sel1 repeat family protein n=1 Tax=Colwellia maritima TaxID=2912588 RepID=A0ABS9X1W6_9GAMM|nr:tetratricopeptide repeat protein [Colwellia maritima]MCI2284242.1 sel1 repeat family protein [Colwellia maritima]